MVDVGFATLGVIPSVRGLRAELEKQTSTFDASGRAAGRRYGDAVGAGAGSRLKTSLKAALAPAAGILAGLGGAKIFGDIISEAQEAAKVGRITAQLIKTTGGAANLSAGQVGNLATSLSKYAAVDDEIIQAGANVMLTFRNVRDEAGKGNDIFSRATKAALDLSTVLGGDMKSSALQLGKALQDPVRGLTMLGRAGVQFTESQKAQIKALVASNDLLGAQKIILSEVEHQVGGAAGANATALDQLGVAFKNLEEAAGTAAAPALNKFATVTANDVIPAVEHLGGIVGDGARMFGSLPTPIKAATGALVAFRAAQALGAGGLLTGGASLVTRGLEDIRLRSMLVTDEFKRLRAGQLDIIQGSGKFTPAAGRMASALGAIEVGAIGAGRGLKAGLSGALNLVGGPWGAAFIAGTAILGKFWAEHQKAKQEVEDFTAAIKADSGAIGENTRQLAVNTLEKEGLLKAATRLGISLETVTNAALGDADALQEIQAVGQGVQDMVAGLNAGMGAAGGNMSQASDDAAKLVNGLSSTNGALADSIASYKRQSEAMGAGATATDKATQATRSYSSQIDDARAQVQKLLDVENKRRNKLLGRQQDELALASALASARKEAKDGAKTLDINTEAGRNNKQALLDLASQWNDSAAAVKNAKGAYADMRQNFINVAKEMGATEPVAKKLANQLLGLPTNKPINVTTPGMKDALAKVKELNDALRSSQRLSRIVISAQAAKNQGEIAGIRRAGGGPIRGPGTGTSDSILMWGSNGEFMQRKAAVDYYGEDFMRRLNNLQVPRFAGGGPVGSSTSSVNYGGAMVNIENMAPANYAEFARFVDAAAQAARRAAAIGGIPVFIR